MITRPRPVRYASRTPLIPYIYPPVGKSGCLLYTSSKVIEYLAIPRNAGTFKIPAVKFSYFDIKSRTYKILTTEEYELHVEKGEGNAAQTIANFTNKEDLKVLNEDIRFIKQNDVTLSQKGDFFFDSMLYWLLYLVPGIAFIIFFIIYRKQDVYKRQV